MVGAQHPPVVGEQLLVMDGRTGRVPCFPKPIGKAGTGGEDAWVVGPQMREASPPLDTPRGKRRQ